MNSLQHLHFQTNAIRFILVFSLSIFVSPFSDSEKSGSLSLIYLLICNQSLTAFVTTASQECFFFPVSLCQLMDHPLLPMFFLTCSGWATPSCGCPFILWALTPPRQAIPSQYGCPPHPAQALTPVLVHCGLPTTSVEARLTTPHPSPVALGLNCSGR